MAEAIHQVSTFVSPLAVVDSQALLGEGVVIDPFVIVESDVHIGNRTHIQAHAHIRSGARIGSDCQVFTGASIGAAPQDLKFNGEPTLAIIGDRTIVREYVTVHRGTSALKQTVVGTDCLLMAYTHIAHDCIIGDNVILANAVQLGGHVHVDDWAILGGLTGVHQFEKIGKHAMIGACSRVVKDVPPFALAGNEPLRFCGVNVIGLRRRGFAEELIHTILQAYRYIYQSGLNISDGVGVAEETFAGVREVAEIIEFFRSSQRGAIPLSGR